MDVVLCGHGELGLQQHGVDGGASAGPARPGQQLAQVLLVQPRVEQVGVRVTGWGLGRAQGYVGTGAGGGGGPGAGGDPAQLAWAPRWGPNLVVIIILPDEGGNVEPSERLLVPELGGGRYELLLRLSVAGWGGASRRTARTGRRKSRLSCKQNFILEM